MKKIAMPRVAFYLILLFFVSIIVVLYRDLQELRPLSSAKGYYSSDPLGERYEVSFDYLDEGTYYFKTKSQFETGTYESIGNHSYELTPGNFTKIVTLNKSGFLFYDKVNQNPVFMELLGNVPGWVHQPEDDSLPIPAEFREQLNERRDTKNP